MGAELHCRCLALGGEEVGDKKESGSRVREVEV